MTKDEIEKVMQIINDLYFTNKLITISGNTSTLHGDNIRTALQDEGEGEKTTIKHPLEYSIYSCKVSWCPICHEHFYNERNKVHTTSATPEHYHELNPLKNPE